MADVENLRTASLYINNQLLSRGLLRDGETIDFSNPANNDGGTAAAMARVMGIVNDLILRRDRDAEQRESLSVAMRTLRADNLRQTSDITRTTEKLVETERKLNLAEASESALRTQLKTAEASARGFKEEVARAKTLVAQTRASCATEVRRRDRQIDTLKKQLGEATRARGTVKNPAVTVITVTGDIGLEKGSPSQAGITANDSYDLRSETNEFLTELAKSLSEENETVLLRLRKLRDELKTMSGWESEVAQRDGHASDVVSGVDELESDLHNILNHLRTILTNPSFVPLEEVVTREEEISRLRDGWTKMETRWKEAVHLIDGWRKRTASNGRPVNEEELKMGLRLSPVRVKDVEETAHGMDLRLPAVLEEEEEEEDVQEMGVQQGHYYSATAAASDDSESSVYDDEINIDEYDVDEPNVQILEQIAEDDDACELAEGTPEPQSGPSRKEPSARRQIRAVAASISAAKAQGPVVEELDLGSSASSLDSLLLDSPSKKPTKTRTQTVATAPAQASVKRPQSRAIPKRLADPAPQQSPLTMAAIAAKLAASEREADAARVRAKLKAARMTKRKPEPAPAAVTEDVVAAAEPSKDVGDPVKKDPLPLPRVDAPEGEL
ncbi:unnamed protein product [Parascedosporium putredinis]|uniref:NIMA interactive protein n=1 Tax=Parascedosporium putredinis TaxID=1442378 RepID=A0A9P1H3D7_9PEZI|nr:unnamed protein product [Parascedosporium putredinis]CAI7995654.1 unnamed protein product [Parascedosporium putredinis]